MKNLIMTPGPTYVHESVRKALSKPITNPDQDSEFFEFYKQTTISLQKLIKTSNEIIILNGEGILGLEASCASLIEPGDRVLCIDNGIFGNGFGDFAKIYGAEVVYFKSSYQQGLRADELQEFLAIDSNYKLATFVHCETPSGITNKIAEISLLLKSQGILTVVDSVAALGGEELETDKWKIDMVLGGSQKCLSAPPGLAFTSISSDAWQAMLARKKPIASFYANLLNWRDWYNKKWFPYTQPISDIYGLKAAVDRLLADDFINRHRIFATAVRQSLQSAGLTLYPLDSYSNTVTTVNIPAGLSFEQLYDTMIKDHSIMIGGAFGYLENKVFRIGHMGENCYEDKLYLTLKALDKTLRKYNIPVKKPIHESFVAAL